MNKYINPYTKGRFISVCTPYLYKVPLLCINVACGKSDCESCKKNNLLPTINELLGMQQKNQPL